MPAHTPQIVLDVFYQLMQTVATTSVIGGSLLIAYALYSTARR